MLGFNTLASTQDIITDGLAVRVLNAKARGWANGIQVGAYRFGMILGGGALLWLFARMGWATMLLGMALLLALTTWPVWRWQAHLHDMRDAAQGIRPLPAAPSQDAKIPQTQWMQRMQALTLAWWSRANTPSMRTCLVLVVCYRFGDQMVSGLMGPFLHDQAVGTETVALMKGVAGSATSLLGAALGGWWLMQVSRRQALLYAGCAQALTFLLYAVAAMGHGGIQLLWAATLLEGLLSTLATVALFAWMMDVADPDHASADYTLMASVGVVVIGVAGVVGAALADWLGYAPVFAFAAGLCSLGAWVMVRHQDRYPVHERVFAAW
jgi:MFS transporter, PAT family, beta-lactamase induction signal transducer AmpG